MTPDDPPATPPDDPAPTGAPGDPPGAPGPPGRRTLVAGWFSFLNGEATAGDVLALRRVRQALREAGVDHDVAWSPRFRPGALSLDDVRPAAYGRLIFVCGPLHGPDVAALHRRFAHCRRIAVGTSVVDARDSAAAGFHRLLARDGADLRPGQDLSARAPTDSCRLPVVGALLTGGQREYGERRLHGAVADTVRGWLADTVCAPVVLETRLDREDGLLCQRPEEFLAVVGRLDAVVTDRLHGLVLALRAGVPAIAVDPVRGGAKLTAQARACRWPALIPGERLDVARLDAWWRWCQIEGRAAARARRRSLARTDDPADALRAALTAPAPDGPAP